jgi:hypothetical protein
VENKCLLPCGLYFLVVVAAVAFILSFIFLCNVPGYWTAASVIATITPIDRSNSHGDG